MNIIAGDSRLAGGLAITLELTLLWTTIVTHNGDTGEELFQVKVCIATTSLN